MDLLTVLTIFVVCVTAYAFVGDSLRSMVKQLGIVLPAFPSAMLREVWQGVVWVLYKVIVGREPSHSVKHSADLVPDDSSLQQSQPISKNAQSPIATPQNTRNDPVVIAPGINDLADIERYLIERLALLVAADELTQTAAIKIGLGIAPGSRSPRYQAARAALQAELTRLEAKPELVGEMAERIKREEMTPTV